MRKWFAALAFSPCLTLLHAESTTTATETTPFIEYNNRIVVFSINHLAYERIKPNAFYTGIEGWGVLDGRIWAWALDDHFLLEGEYRAGYNFFWNGRDHFTPIAGIGFFKDFQKLYHHGRRQSRSGIVYGTIGFLYDHEFTSVFNLGLNVKGILGGPVERKKQGDWGCLRDWEGDWGSPIGGVDVSLPITFRFGYQRHWDIRIEPFDIYLRGSKNDFNYVGFRNTVGYRF